MVFLKNIGMRGIQFFSPNLFFLSADDSLPYSSMIFKGQRIDPGWWPISPCEHVALFLCLCRQEETLA